MKRPIYQVKYQDYIVNYHTLTSCVKSRNSPAPDENYTGEKNGREIDDMRAHRMGYSTFSTTTRRLPSSILFPGGFGTRGNRNRGISTHRAAPHPRLPGTLHAPHLCSVGYADGALQPHAAASLLAFIARRVLRCRCRSMERSPSNSTSRPARDSDL